VHFDKDPIVQLVGLNGHGKSSIPLILEEVCFNKNSKGIKKGDILNRYTKDKSYSIELEFEKDGDIFEVKTSRGSTQTISLTKNGISISSHTATNTFKLLEEILGVDAKNFSQLIYQSSSSSLSFLTATDTVRKKFLIDLLNLSKYIEAFDHFKSLAKVLSEEIITLESKINTTSTWLTKHSKENLDKLCLQEYPEFDGRINQELHEATAKLKDIDTTNKKIAKNNTYKEQLNAIPIEVIATDILAVEDNKPYITAVAEHRKTVKDATAFVAKISKLNGTCPTCLQEIDTKKLSDLISEQHELIKIAEKAIVQLDTKIEELGELSKETAKVAKLKADWESYHSLIDNTLPVEVLNAEDLQSKINSLQALVDDNTNKISLIEKENLKASAHNSRIDVILAQMDSMKEDLLNYNKELGSLNDRLTILQILQKTFSTNGLIAYKIECLVKSLEILANEYLSDLSDGRFQLTFKVSTGDKLNVLISDNGKDIDILALSGGEKARVNTATLLAIRKLMQSLSNTRINLLILDETIDSLDMDGKEKLVEVLLKEEYLNTFLISHGFTHPLLEKINVIKENNISRLE
jgi:DNA repair exonuclease SbcCD ATPase subunit